MTTWNYRVFREAAGDLTIREVMYDANGQILSCSRDAVTVSAASIDALIQLIDDLKPALRLPILAFDDIPAAGEPPPVGHQTTLTHAELIAELGLGQSKGRARLPKRKAS